MILPWWWWCHHRRLCGYRMEESWTPTTTTWMLVNSSILLGPRVLVLNHRRIVILFCFPSSFCCGRIIAAGAATPLVVTGLWMGIRCSILRSRSRSSSSIVS